MAEAALAAVISGKAETDPAIVTARLSKLIVTIKLREAER
jgi:hypothetical protein